MTPAISNYRIIIYTIINRNSILPMLAQTLVVW